MDESKKEQNKSWLSRAVGVSYSASWDELDPVKSISDFAREVALESALRGASGSSPVLSGESHRERSWLYETEMASMAKQLVIFCAQNGQQPTGQPLGAFKALLAQAPWPAKGAALQKSASMVAMSPEWARAVEQVANGQAVELDLPEITTAAPKYSGGLTGFERDFVKALADARLKASHAALSELDREMQPVTGEERVDRMKQASAQARMTLGAIRELRVGASAREFDTGSDWDVSVSHAFKLSRDDHLASLGRSFVSLVDRSGLDPRVDPEVIAGVSTLVSMMGPLAGTSFLKELGQATKDRVIHGGWNHPIKRATELHGGDWGVGVAQRAAPPTMGVPMDIAPPAYVGLESFKSGVENGESQEARLLRKARASDAGFNAGFAVGGAIKRFVASFDRSVAATQKAVESLAHVSPKQWAADVIIKGNEMTDRAENAVRNKWGAARDQATDAAVGLLHLGTRTVAGTTDAAVGLAHLGARTVAGTADAAVGLAHLGARTVAGTADAAVGLAHLGVRAVAGTTDAAVGLAVRTVAGARDAVVGKVGELSQATFAAVGALAFKAADALPSEQAMQTAGRARQAKIIMAASIGGALLLGYALAPVAATLAVVVAAGLTGIGAKSALEKGAESFREIVSNLPSALEGLAERLGAKRALKIQVPEVATTSTPGM